MVVMVERLTSAATEVSVERDCIPEFSGRLRQPALANSNMKLRRLDLASELVGTIGFSWTLAAFGSFRTLLAFVGLTCAALPFQLMCIRKVSALLPDQMLSTRAAAASSVARAPPPAALTRASSSGSAPLPGYNSRAPSADGNSNGFGHSPPPNFAAAGNGAVNSERIPQSSSSPRQNPEDNGGLRFPRLLRRAAGAAQQLPRVWRAYFSQPVLPASLALIMLYFNAVLSPGGLMTAFLSSLGLPGTAAASFRGACAIMGFVGTAAGRTAIARLGLLQAGMLATSLQASLLFGAWVVYKSFLAGGSIQSASGMAGMLSASALGVPLCVWLFCGLIVLSRIAFWTFDMVDAQILQTAVAAKEAASISSTEVSLCCFSEVIMLGIAIMADDPSTFGNLVTLSMGAVKSALDLTICLFDMKYDHQLW
ncbi:hypothetical protein WJX84_002421 [Apatococcus fuscideae]